MAQSVRTKIMGLTIKICGLSTAETLDAALRLHVDMVGFVFFAKSPRHVSFETAALLGAQVKGRAQKVALTVNADDAAVQAICDSLKPDILQLHGHESPARVAEIRALFGLPVIKAIGISGADDLMQVAAYEPVADWLLFDAKPPKDAKHPGGNGIAFDWTVLRGRSFARPALLSGGLDPENVAGAVAVSALDGVDVSSGVETRPGIKDINRMTSFVAQARAGYAQREHLRAGVEK